FPDKAFRVPQGFRSLHVKFGANLPLDDFLKRALTVGRLPDGRAYIVQVEQSRIAGRHDDHLAPQVAGGDFTASGNVKRTHTINSSLGVRCWFTQAPSPQPPAPT